MAITNGYTTLEEVKRQLDIPGSDSIDDALLELCIESASRAIDNMTERTYFQGTATRVFVPDDSFFCPIDDLYPLTTLKTSDDADQDFDIVWTSTDYQLEPLNGSLNGTDWPYTGIRAVGDYLWPTVGSEATVQVTGVFGWPSVPTAIQQATICSLLGITSVRIVRWVWLGLTRWVLCVCRMLTLIFMFCWSRTRRFGCFNG